MTDPPDPHAGDAAPGQKPGAGTASGTGAPGGGERRRGALLSLLVLILAAMAAAAGGGYWLWQQLHTVREASQRQEARWQARAQALEERLAETAANQRQRMHSELEALRGELAALSQSLGTLEAWAHAGGAGGVDARTWSLAQAKVLLLTAAYRTSAHQREGALRALEAASARLSAVNDPRLRPVHERLAADLDALRTAPDVDLARIDQSLGELARGVRALPATTPSSGATASEAPPSEEGWRGVLEAVWRNAKTLVVVRRVGEGGQAGWFPAHARVRRALESARVAALRRDAEAFHAALRTAREWLVAGFDSRMPDVQAMVQRIEALEAAALTAVRADPLETLQLLERALGASPPAPPSTDEMQRQ